MVLIYPSVTANVKLNEWVSVPLRGLWFLSKTRKNKSSFPSWGFPSPYGDYGSYQRKLFKRMASAVALFPSPYGDYGSYQYCPYGINVSYDSMVSVPLRGLWFLSKWVRQHFTTIYSAFPSPYGDYGSYRQRWWKHDTVCRICFRPLTGIMVLIVKPTEKQYTALQQVSVPLRGLWFLSIPTTTLSSTKTTSFRPLTGIMVLIDRCVTFEWCKSGKVSVPLRGLWFLSAPLINGFIAPSKMPFAGRIFFSPHFSHFCGKWFSKIVLSLIFKPAGRNDSFYVFKKQVGRINTVLPN